MAGSPKEITLDVTDLLMPHPITEESSLSSIGSNREVTDGVRGQRATSSPTYVPTKSPTYAPTNREVLEIASPTSTTHTFDVLDVLTPAPTAFCVKGGIPCPRRRVALCCSDVCV